MNLVQSAGMAINWNVVAQIVWSIILLVIGAWVNRRFESRAGLISYFQHVSQFNHTAEGGQVIPIHTHSVTLRNTGRKSAENVRVRHFVLPDFNIYPPLAYHVNDIPGDGKEIVIPRLVPGEQITISYLYFPPTTYDKIHAGIKYDEGFAQPIPVLIQRQYPQWFNHTAVILMLIGIASVVYLGYHFVDLIQRLERLVK